MFVPTASRFDSDRQPCVQMPLPVSLVIAVLYFCNAALPPTPAFSSHWFSSKSLPPKNESAILVWHLIAAAASLPSSLPTVSAHLSLSFAFAAVSIVPASSPDESIGVVPSQ